MLALKSELSYTFPEESTSEKNCRMLMVTVYMFLRSLPLSLSLSLHKYLIYNIKSPKVSSAKCQNLV
jgi:hypothetical protein